MYMCSLACHSPLPQKGNAKGVVLELPFALCEAGLETDQHTIPSYRKELQLHPRGPLLVMEKAIQFYSE